MRESRGGDVIPERDAKRRGEPAQVKELGRLKGGPHYIPAKKRWVRDP